MRAARPGRRRHWLLAHAHEPRPTLKPMDHELLGPLALELREISEGRRGIPQTQARRQHYVPAFALAQFANPPGERKGFMAQLHTGTGKPGKTKPNDACRRPDLYTQEAADGRDRTLEALLSIIERHSAQAIQRIVADSRAGPSPEDRQTLSYYVGFQYLRSPMMLEQIGQLAETIDLTMFAVHFEDRASFARVYREAIAAKASDDDIERMREYMKERLASDAMRLRDPKAESLRLMMEVVDGLAEAIDNMRWTLIVAGDDEFVISDRALALHDPTPRHPWSGHGLYSSPNAVTTIALSPEITLQLDHGQEPIPRTVATRAEVRRINLRTYGWAERFIYGRSQAVVQRVQRQKKDHPSEVIRPRPMKQAVLRPADRDDPRGVWIKGKNGHPEYMTYAVLEPGHTPGEIATIGAETGRRVLQKAISEGHASSDRIVS
jgi:hypothetical protein